MTLLPIPAPTTLTYTNWKGETSERTIHPLRIWYGTTDWHPEPQWFLSAVDLGKSAERDFALKDFGKPNVCKGNYVNPEVKKTFFDTLRRDLAVAMSEHLHSVSPEERNAILAGLKSDPIAELQEAKEDYERALALLESTSQIYEELAKEIYGEKSVAYRKVRLKVGETNWPISQLKQDVARYEILEDDY